jgi:hypothetical protein
MSRPDDCEPSVVSIQSSVKCPVGRSWFRASHRIAAVLNGYDIGARSGPERIAPSTRFLGASNISAKRERLVDADQGGARKH